MLSLKFHYSDILLSQQATIVFGLHSVAMVVAEEALTWVKVEPLLIHCNAQELPTVTDNSGKPAELAEEAVDAAGGLCSFRGFLFSGGRPPPSWM
ncbi:unnamed protein product [Acanthoscelides obtectus]|uniref:Uncharacterized protein n=1 Tax=Acanthoscelides obtectus TaxID=200917 RepID=A0A9P0P3A4_ACAOB|nr:unnamed protein product [Acanthoscelides obtectus]CAK1629160.1 hypothetical protein AOBTE_LOCUS5604 [Acanthoscelides obtectus]